MSISFVLAAARMTDEEIDELATRLRPLAGDRDNTLTLRALRELGQGNTGKPPLILDPLGR